MQTTPLSVHVVYFFFRQPNLHFLLLSIMSVDLLLFLLYSVLNLGHVHTRRIVDRKFPQFLRNRIIFFVYESPSPFLYFNTLNRVTLYRLFEFRFQVTFHGSSVGLPQ